MKLLNDVQFRILEILKTQGPMSIDALTKRLKRPKTALRRALLALERRKMVERRFQKSGRGRPALGFALGAQAQTAFPTKEGELLNALMSFLLAKGHRPVLEKFFEEYWERKYQKVVERIRSRKSRDLNSRLDVLKDVLSDEGFYPRSQISGREGHLTLRECHCPISAAASVVDIPCQMEARLISRVLNLECVSAVPMSAKESHCRFTLKNR